MTPGPADAPPQAGDVFEIDSLDFIGNHKKHAKKATTSDYLRCTFTAELEPDCFGYTAIGGSLLRFHGIEIIGGTGRYQGATGKVSATRRSRAARTSWSASSSPADLARPAAMNAAAGRRHPSTARASRLARPTSSLMTAHRT